MHPSRSMLRPAIAVAIALTLVATAGCSWFRKDNALYTPAPQDRPLEVPPDLDRPDTSSAMAVPQAEATTSVTRSSMGAGGTTTGAGGATTGASAPAAGNGFTVPAARDDVFQRIEGLLAGIEGVSVISKAQLLGTYDIDAGSSKFLVRVSQTDAGSYVSAVDPRGLAATGADAVRVIEALRAGLSQ